MQPAKNEQASTGFTSVFTDNEKDGKKTALLEFQPVKKPLLKHSIEKVVKSWSWLFIYRFERLSSLIACMYDCTYATPKKRCMFSHNCIELWKRFLYLIVIFCRKEVLLSETVYEECKWLPCCMFLNGFTQFINHVYLVCLVLKTSALGLWVLLLLVIGQRSLLTLCFKTVFAIFSNRLMSASALLIRMQWARVCFLIRT